MKPIIGCEFYLAPDMHDHKDKTRYHQVLLAKNQIGYKNLTQLSSLGFIEGYYYKPRIDKKIIKKYAEGLMATTCCLAGEIPKTILKKGEKEAEKTFFRMAQHFLATTITLNYSDMVLKSRMYATKYYANGLKNNQVKVIATNDVHYINQSDNTAQDVLLCLQTGKDYDDPNRMRFANDQFFLKSPQEMATLFQDIPESIAHTTEIAEKVDTLSLEKRHLVTHFSNTEKF